MLTLQTKEFTKKFIELPNRVKLSYVEQGDPLGMPVLFLHGFTDSWRSFEPVLPHLPESIHAFALSQRGHGDTDRPEAGYQPQDFAADAAAFIDTLDLGSAVIAGHSMGSIVAQRFAIDYPEHILGLVLIGAGATFQDNPAVIEFWETAVSHLEDPINPGFVREFQESTLAQPVPPAFLNTVIQESLKVPARVWQAAFQGLLEVDFSTELGKIKVPTLVVWGDQDGLVSRNDQDAFMAAIENAQLVVYPGAGHGTHWEEPVRFAADLAAFIEKLDN